MTDQPATEAEAATWFRHDATNDCDGTPIGGPCVECGSRLCACEKAYGHDCEPPIETQAVAIGKAVVLGAEHGRAAAEAYRRLVETRGPTTTITLPDGETATFENRFSRPTPDMTAVALHETLGLGLERRVVGALHGYIEAFQAAVDAALAS